MYIEIRAGEGGDDAKMLVREMFSIYQRVATRLGFTLWPHGVGEGFLHAHVSGPGSSTFFLNEVGGHRWQRVPPNERRGRVHTSTVTVAALEDRQVLGGNPVILEDDLKWEFFRCGGKGGQKQNKTNSGARVRHVPTGITTECREERSQPQNRRRCLEKLHQMMRDEAFNLRVQFANSVRKAQIGSGMRGDKVRTYRVKDDMVTDHRTDKKTSLQSVIRGDFSGLV